MDAARAKYAEALRLHGEEKLLAAIRLLDAAISELEALKASGDSKAAELLAEVASSEQVKEMRWEMGFISDLYREVQNTDRDWQPVSEGKVKVWYKKEDDTPIHTVKIEIVLEEVALEQLLCVLYESDLWATIFPFLKFSNLLVKPKRCQQVIHLGLRNMWPVWARDATVLGFAIDAFDELGGILCVCKSVDSHPGAEIPPVKGSCVRADVHLGGYMLTLVDERTTRMTAVVNMDPKLARVPHSVINFFTRHVCALAFTLLESRVQKFKNSEEHQKRMRENREFYAWLEKGVEESLAKLRARGFAAPSEAAPIPAPTIFAAASI